jgi:hypothetical protein
MNDMIWISGIIGIFSVVILALLLNLKKTDRDCGCEKYRKFGCKNFPGHGCDFPNCETLKKYRIFNNGWFKKSKLEGYLSVETQRLA